MADTFKQVELNRCAFLHDGAIESLCVFNPAGDDEVLENGMIVVVDKANGEIKKASGSETGVVFGLNYDLLVVFYVGFCNFRKNQY